MAHLTIVANITTKVDTVDMVKAELLKLIDITRAEEGCVVYDLHQDNKNPAHFMFYEIWESWDHWQTHRNNTHMLEFRAATKDAIEEFLVNEMTQIA